MKPVLFALSAAEGLTAALSGGDVAEAGQLETRRFPDRETYLRLLTPVAGRDVLLLCTLDDPDAKTVPLLFAAAAAREQGARRVALVAPYLAYMRQDLAFRAGEAVTSVTYARLLSSAFDWLVTVDPHLHRHPTLGAIYDMEAEAVSAARPIAAWIRDEVERPLLIGPDEESRQWVAEIARLVGAPFTVLRKERRGDLDVGIAGEQLETGDRTPVIIDDIISSAHTMAEAVRVVRSRGFPPPICVGVHALFAGDALQVLEPAGAARIVTVDTVAHPTNAIAGGAEIAAAIARWSARQDTCLGGNRLGIA